MTYKKLADLLMSISYYFLRKTDLCLPLPQRFEKKNLLMKVNIKQEVQGLQAFAFSVVTVNDEHKKPGFKIKCRG